MTSNGKCTHYSVTVLHVVTFINTVLLLLLCIIMYKYYYCSDLSAKSNERHTYASDLVVSQGLPVYCCDQ